MDEFLELLDRHYGLVNQMVEHLENENVELDLEPLRAYIPQLEQMTSAIFELVSQCALELDQAFVLQVLNDILSGLEQADRVLLVDALRYGLMEIYSYVGTELRGEGGNE